jgi:hypothetical protein
LAIGSAMTMSPMPRVWMIPIFMSTGSVLRLNCRAL